MVNESCAGNFAGIRRFWNDHHFVVCASSLLTHTHHENSVEVTFLNFFILQGRIARWGNRWASHQRGGKDCLQASLLRVVNPYGSCTH